MESPLSFNSSENFRKKLLVRNLPTYKVDGVFSSGDKPAADEFRILDYSIVDSVPVEVIGDQQERLIYPINQYGPENKNSYGDMVKININRNYKTNEGEYGFADTFRSDLELIGNDSELQNIVKNVYKPQNNRADYGDSVYYINNDKTINTVGSGEYTITDTFNSNLFQIGNNSEVEHKVLNKYKPSSGTFGGFGDTKYEINDVLTLPSNFRQIFGYGITYTDNSELEQVGNTQETILITKNKYSPENSNQYGDTKYSINNDLILGSNQGEYNYGDTIGDELELKGVSIRPTLFTNNQYRPEGGQSVFEVEPYRIQKNLIIGSGNYDYSDTIGSELEFEGKTDRPILIASNQYGPDNPIKGEVPINRNLQTRSNEGEYGYPDTVRSGLEVVGVDERKPTFLQNAWGPEGNQSSEEVDPYRKLKNLTINAGNYDVADTDQNELEYVGGVKETEAYVKNKYVTGDGDYKILSITDIQYTTTGLPYANSDSTFVFVPSTYTPVNILLSDNPNGSDGSLSQDSQLAALGAKQLQKEFKHRVALELLQQTLGRANILNSNVNPDTGEISTKPNLDPFNAIGLLTGNIPIIARNYSITNPDLFLGQAINFAAKLAGTYSPYSYIPGEYFDYPNSKGNGPFTNVVSTLGGALGNLFSVNQPANQSSSELLVEFTSVATRGLLYEQLKYNPYRPNYKIGNNLLAPPGVFYVGDRKSSITEAVSPFDQLPLSKDGTTSSNGPVLSYGNVGKLYEGDQLSGSLFGLNTRNFYSSGAKDTSTWASVNIVGGLTWVSDSGTGGENYTLPGKLQGRGGVDFTDDSDFNFDRISSGYDPSQSTKYDFTPGSLLDVTQKLVDAGNQSPNKLEHVGNAINQVSKVFNDGYQELTKGSRVIRYTTKNSVPGGAVEGLEYCRVFTKDRPYYTFDELQKPDGNIRKYTNSVLDSTFNLNIAPMGGVDSTNIKNGKVKKYMLSLENLSWRTSNRPGYTYEDLPDCEKGPNGGRIMWFPPYDLNFDESINTSWQDNTFLGRTEPIYTYTNTSRKGNVSFKVIVDHPSIMNVLVNKELENESSNETINQVIDSFFAGCTKYDLYDLVKKFPMFTPSDIFEVQLLNTPEDVKTYTDTLPNEIVEKEEASSNTTTIEPTPTPAPCTEWQINVGLVTTDISYTDCSGSLVTLTGLTSTATTICVKSTTTPIFTISAATNTVTNTTKPCITPPTVTATPPLVTEAPIADQFREVGFFFHNDFPDPRTDRIYASEPYDAWLTKYKGLENKYLNTGGNSTPATSHDFGAALNKIIKYNDLTYDDYTNYILNAPITEQNKYLEAYIDTRKTSIVEFFKFINSEFEEAQNFLKKIGTALDAGEKVSFELLGSASALNSVEYNIKLSKRRIDSVMQWMFKQSTPNGTKFEKYYTDKKLTIKMTPTGETGKLIEPLYSKISCTKDFKTITNEGVVSINAMACRRVKIVDIIVTNTNTASQTSPGTTQTSPTNNDGNTSIIDPVNQNNDSGVNTNPVTTEDPTEEFVKQTPTGNVETDITPQSSSLKSPPAGKIEPKMRTDLTKRLARKLLTECNYFELVRKENPMIYDGIKSKIKHFHPAFHSITPEGLNARLTFLQQCMRPGDTIPTVSTDGNNTKLIYNDVTNSVFGAPPICVLRIGDFFHTKIAIDSLTIGYEDGRFDLNPEGIGVQPMIADVKLGFNFIGGHGLAGPIAALQNALSFNYYANTEMYDERAESTEDVTSQYDAEIFEDIKNEIGVIESDDDRTNTTDGGVPIGVPVTTYLDPNNLNLVSGTISYTEMMKQLITSTKSSLTTTIDTLEKINSEFLIGGLQILTKDRKYIDGYIGVGTTDNVKIFGKADDIQGKVENLITKAKEDVDNDLCPAIDGLNNQNFTDQDIRKIKNQIKSLIDSKQDVLIGALENYSTQIGNEELKLINVIDKVNYVNNSHDGYVNNKGKVIVYNISGTTEITPPVEASVTNTLQELTADSNIIKNTINLFYNQINNGIIIPSGDTEYNDNFVFSCLLGNNIITENENRFFILFGTDVLKDPVIFASSIVSPVQNTVNDIAWNSFVLKNLGWNYSVSLTAASVNEPIPNGLYSNYEVSKKTVDESFKKFKDDYFNKTFNTFKPYNESKKRIMTYEIILTSTSPYDDELKDIYSDSNSSGDKFNLKKTFT
jgi:outer membrane protein OmpA-like peptidoglycan-associated protein